MSSNTIPTKILTDTLASSQGIPASTRRPAKVRKRASAKLTVTPVVRKSETSRKASSGKDKPPPSPQKIVNPFRLALANILTHGDTDVCPLSPERFVLGDCADETCEMLESMRKDIPKARRQFPYTYEDKFVNAPQGGLRLVTEIDPLWNAMMLGIACSIAKQAEAIRIPIGQQRIHSHRYQPDTTANTLFHRKIGYASFYDRSVELSETSRYVTCTDISDFFARLPLSAVTSGLTAAGVDGKTIDDTLLQLRQFGKGSDYGLPVGGPASRILAELALTFADRRMVREGIDFIRFVDDYRVFNDTEAGAHADLHRVATILRDELGLTLSKAKTKVLASEVFDIRENRFPSPLADWRKVRRSHLESLALDYQSMEERQFAMSQALEHVDLIGLLTAELGKKHLDPGGFKAIVSAVTFLDRERCESAVRLILENFGGLLTVMPSVLIALRASFRKVDYQITEEIQVKIRSLIAAGSHLVSSPSNLGFAVRLLSDQESEENHATLAGIYGATRSPSLRRDIILAMAQFRAERWLTAQMNDTSSLGQWERRAMIIAAASLGETGARWRTPLLKKASPYDQMVDRWARGRVERDEVKSLL